MVTEFDMEAKPTRSTYNQTVKRIEEDLNKAIEYDIQDEIYRFNSDVAKGYLAGSISGHSSIVWQLSMPRSYWKNIRCSMRNLTRR